MNSSRGTSTRVAPTASDPYTSFTEMSKSNGAWFAKRSSLVKPKVRTNSSTKLAMAPWLTATPFGVPVEPEVNMTYAGSHESTRERAASSALVSTGWRSSSSATRTSRSGRAWRTASAFFSPATTRASPRVAAMCWSLCAGASVSTGT